jgi:hypothetical protein
VTRRVILHYHFFKNAGSSVDRLLQESFPERWVTREFEPAHVSANGPHVAKWIAEHPDACAFSSHTAGLPVPAIEGLETYPIVFLRHPLDRIQSAYEFERRQGMSGHGGFGAVLAKHTTIAGYVEVQLAQPAQRQCRNFHAARLAQMFPASTGDESCRALRAVKELPFVGVVDLYEQSVATMVTWLRPVFPDIHTVIVHENRTETAGTSLDQRLDEFANALGPTLYEELLQANALDHKLYEAARKRVLASS